MALLGIGIQTTKANYCSKKTQVSLPGSLTAAHGELAGSSYGVEASLYRLPQNFNKGQQGLM